VDSLSLEKYYLHKSDSLFERGEYEAARDYISYASSYFSPRNYHSKELTEKAKFYLEMQRKVDVAITYHLTDSMKYNYRMEEGSRRLKTYKDTATFVYYLLEAHKIFPDKPEPMEHIKSSLDLHHRRMDSVVLSNNGAERYLFIGKQPRYEYDQVAYKTTLTGYQFRYPNYNLISNQRDTVFCLKDSLPFKGVLISLGTHFEDIYGEKISRHISTYSFEHGMTVSQTSYQLCKTPLPKLVANPFAHFIPLEQDEYICLIETNSDKSRRTVTISYYPSGAIAKKSVTLRGNPDLYESVSYSPLGDSIGFSYQRYSEDSIYLIKCSKTFFETGQLKSFSYSKELLGGEELVDEYFEGNEQGDTLSYRFFNASNQTTLSIDQWNDKAHLLRMCYSKGDSLVGIPTPRMLFLDENYHFISESAFVQNYNKRLREGSTSSLFEAFPDLQNGKKQRYLFYAYPKSIGGKETRKHSEKIRKIQLKLEQD
jgi:hypothetical protein